MCGGGGIFKSVKKGFKSVTKGVRKGFRSVTKGVSKAVSGITKGVSGILKSPIVSSLAGAGIGFLAGGPVGALIGGGLGMAGSSMLGQPELPRIDMNIPEAPIPAPTAIAPTGTGALVEVGAASDELRSASGKRGPGKRTRSSVAGLGAGGLRL